VKAVSDKRRKRDAVYAVRRVQVWEREGGLCRVLPSQGDDVRASHRRAGWAGPAPADEPCWAV
jgi:hypothetical protein